MKARRHAWGGDFTMSLAIRPNPIDPTIDSRLPQRAIAPSQGTSPAHLTPDRLACNHAINAFSATAQALTGSSVLSVAPDLPAAKAILGCIGNAVRPAAIAADAILLGGSMLQDRGPIGTNTLRMGTDIAGNWLGSFLGGRIGETLGAAVGTAMEPGAGTIVGAAIGGILGGISGSFGGGVAAAQINNLVGEKVTYPLA
jgi:hypothetical protein